MTTFLELLPMWALFEGSSWLAVLFERRQQAPAASFRRQAAPAPDGDR
jgi:Sec-independent protein secretion pathway component TatC